MDQNSLIFLHIPKTAGSTFHTILNKRYDAKHVQNVFGSRYFEPEIKQFVETPNSDKSHIKLLKGHMPFGLHKYMPSKSDYIAILRDPVERVISQFYYIKKNINNPLHETVEGNKMSLKEFVSSGVAIGMNNGQCRFLNGDFDEYPFDGCTEELLRQVKKHVDEHFIWLGLTERFDESILILRDKLGWKNEPNYIRANVSKTRKKSSSIDPSVLETIKAYNKFDIALYEYANELLDLEIAKISDFDERLENFKKRNAMLEKRWGWLPDRMQQMFI